MYKSATRGHRPKVRPPTGQVPNMQNVSAYWDILLCVRIEKPNYVVVEARCLLFDKITGEYTEVNMERWAYSFDYIGENGYEAFVDRMYVKILHWAASIENICRWRMGGRRIHCISNYPYIRRLRCQKELSKPKNLTTGMRSSLP